MTRINDDTTEGDIVIGNQIFEAWRHGKSISEIAEEMGLPIRTAARALKDAQKSRVRTGAESYAKKYTL